jgi:hypothetical protein
MADNQLSQLALSHNDFVSAYDERQRLFNALRSLTLTDEERREAAKKYAAAAKHFDEMRKAIVK